MTLVIASSAEQFEFLKQFRNHEEGNLSTYQLKYKDERVNALANRLTQGQPSVLHYRGPEKISWMIVGGGARELERTMERVARFVVPSYAVFAENITRRLKFDTSKGVELHRLGAILYPNGFYRLDSPLKHGDEILERLMLWLRMEHTAERGVQRARESPTYHRLYHQFQESLAAHDWATAEELIVQVQRLMLTQAENIHFMRLRLLAAQQQWDRIWNYPRRAELVTGRVPREVRAALLTSFYVAHLVQAEDEGNWTQALATFGNESIALGKLLTIRDNITQPAVMRVFAYQAVYEGNHAEFTNLRALAGDVESRRVMGALELLLPRPDPAVAARSASDRVRDALYRGQYDLALASADELADHVERLSVRVKVASESDDDSFIETVIAELEALYPEDRVLLVDSYHIGRKITELQERFTSRTTQGSGEITNWADWLAAALAQPQDIRLEAALDALRINAQELRVTVSDVEKLHDQLQSVWITVEHQWQQLRWSILKEAVIALTTDFLNDPDFPNPATYFSEIYEILYVLAWEQEDRTDTGKRRLLRLAEARLAHQPHLVETTASQLLDRFTQPIPKLESLVIEVFELLGDYGVQPQRLADCYRRWMPAIIDLPTCDLTSVAVWSDYHRWIQPGDDLVRLLENARQRLNTEALDPIGNLPEGYSIAIFTLQKSSAERAIRLLSERNPKLGVRGYYETHPNEMMKSAARNADKIIIVTSCITHAVTFAIEPLGGERIVPCNYRGTDSILRAIENAVI